MNGKKKIVRHSSGKKITGILVLGCAIVVASAVCVIVLPGKSEARGDVSAVSEEPSQADMNQIEYKGKKYVYNSNLTNILFMGIDKAEEIDTTYMPGEAGQADCIMLLSLDKETKEARILQISRNTMTQVDIYDVMGDAYNTIQAQLATQYAYCTGGSRSCWAMKKTVEELLYNLPIDGYLSLSVNGIGEINDALGGVNVVMTEEDEKIDSSFQTGTSVLLQGDYAEKYVRFRDTSVFNSNEDRMRRQVNYVTAMISTMRSHGGSALYELISPFFDEYIETDLDAEQIDALSSYTYLTDEVEYLPGETVMGEEFEEFYPGETALQEMIINTYYTEVR